MENNDELKKLADEQDFLEMEFEGMDGIGESLPVIQWTNDRKAYENKHDRGGFTMTLDNVELAGDYPAGAQPDKISFEPNADNPQGSTEQCYSTTTLTIYPFAKRFAWFAERVRLPRDFDYKSLKAAGVNPYSKRQVQALVKGAHGYFIALVTTKSTTAEDLGNSLEMHNRASQKKLKANNITRRGVRINGFRWFALTLTAGTPKLRGQTGKQSTVTPLEYGGTGDLLHSELRAEWYDGDRVREFETAWNDAPGSPAETPTASPAMPFPEEPPSDDANYPEF